MRKLKFFDIRLSLPVLKKMRNDYALKHHPDKQKNEAAAKAASDMMALINDEYDYVINPKNRIPVISPSAGGPIFNKAKRGFYQHTGKSTFGDYSEKEKRQAQDLFHALSNGKGVDYDQFVNVANSITNWIAIIDIYSRVYGNLYEHIKCYVKDPENIQYILTTLNQMIAYQAKTNLESNITSVFNIIKRFKR
ncbi:MAG TPA: hypothetical protein VGC65_00250 [Bacteroidia bacterium]|jgi:curved DNA-binding protein CbpA